MSRIIACLAFCLLTFISAACEKAALLAPTGSAVTLSINTTTVPLNGTAQITAIVIEDGGNAPQNGTQVTFTTTLGSIDPIDAQTHGGRATATFSAGNRAGEATIRAFSGDAEAAEGTVRVGAGGGSITLRVESTSVNGIGIVAQVLDDQGNPVAGAPVTFTTTVGLITPGFVNADQNGEARANLVTSQTASVTATSSGATSSLSVEVGALTLAATTTAPEVGVATNFTVTPASGAFSSVVIDFGDQTPTTTLNNVNAVRAFSHTYAQRGTYTVTATGTTVTGSRAVTSISVTVNDRAPLQVTLTPNPPIVSIGNATMQGIVAFTVAPSGLPTGVAVLSVNWDFGDGGGTTTTALTTSHRYITPGTYTARVVVRATNGQQSTAEALVRVNP